MEALRQEWISSLEALRAGDYTQWPRHECIPCARAGTSGYYPTETFDHPVWDGSEKPITLLVNAEFGHGDTIMFSRFLPLAAKRVKRLILRCDLEFHKFFTDVSIVDKEDELPEFDEIIHMMALPKVLGVREISGASYLRPNPQYPSGSALSVLDYVEFTKIGICWIGNPFSPRDPGRSIPVEMFQSWCAGGMKFFSLQRLTSCPDGFFGMRPHLQDWNATAHLLSRLDCVVSVDTAVAHLAGALGVPTCLLIPIHADWRWQEAGEVDRGNKTIWYDSVQVFRQREEGDWQGVLDRVWAILNA